MNEGHCRKCWKPETTQCKCLRQRNSPFYLLPGCRIAVTYSCLFFCFVSFFLFISSHIVIFSSQCYKDLGNNSAALLWTNLASELPVNTKEVAVSAVFLTDTGIGLFSKKGKKLKLILRCMRLTHQIKWDYVKSSTYLLCGKSNHWEIFENPSHVI